MSDRDQVMWKGKRAEDLTRDEAVEAFKQTFRLACDMQETRRRIDRMHAQAAEARARMGW